MSYQDKTGKLEKLSQFLVGNSTISNQDIYCDYDSAINRLYYSMILRAKELEQILENSNENLNNIIKNLKNDHRSHESIKKILLYCLKQNGKGQHVVIRQFEKHFDKFREYRVSADYSSFISRKEDYTNSLNAYKAIIQEINKMRYKWSKNVKKN